MTTAEIHHWRWVVQIGSIAQVVRWSLVLLLIRYLINLSRIETVVLLNAEINHSSDPVWVVSPLGPGYGNASTNLYSYNIGGMLLMSLLGPIHISCRCIHHL